ncbi:alpha/beta fold hydrolase [Hoeflea sp. TYP-13]|uniref:alpha/beta fold hydrolase n=1 Tax=Hoeflea sp. TYP-13 TaxID=3230023 RepID=UPI0034C66919
MTKDAQDTRTDSGFDQVYFTASDGLRLAARDYGRGRPGTENRDTVVCLPGLTRNGGDFHYLALILSQSEVAPRRVVCFDYRGRGLSEWDREKANYNIQIETDDLLAGCAALGVKHAAFIGTSRGALIIHVLAAVRPSMMAAAILNDAGPVVEGAGLAQIMAYHDRIKAPGSLYELAMKLKAMQGTAFTALSDADWNDLAEASFEEKDGKISAKFDPALIEMLRAIDLNSPLPTLWPQFEGLRNIPLLTIRGENSSLLTEATVDEMAKRHPAMRRFTAPGQGHAPLLHIGELPKAIGSFLNNAGKPRRR